MGKGHERMYKEKTQEWMRHLDFIVIDLLMLLLAFALAYLSRYDIHIQNKDIYVSLALILLLLDFAVMIIGGTTRATTGSWPLRPSMWFWYCCCA